MDSPQRESAKSPLLRIYSQFSLAKIALHTGGTSQGPPKNVPY